MNRKRCGSSSKNHVEFVSLTRHGSIFYQGAKGKTYWMMRSQEARKLSSAARASGKLIFINAVCVRRLFVLPFFKINIHPLNN